MTPRQNNLWLSRLVLCALGGLIGWSDAFGQVGSDGPVTVRIVGAEANAYADVVRIEDVALVEGGDPRLRERVSQLDLDAFDASSQSLTIASQQIAYRLRLARISPEQFQVIGPEFITVHRQQATDERPLLERLLHSQMVAEFHLQPGDIQIQIVGPVTGLLARFRLDPASTQLRAQLPPEIPLGNQTLEVQLWDRTGRQATTSLNANIAVLRDLVMARSNISRGEVLTPDRIERVRRPVTTHQVQFASYEQVVGHVAQTPIQQFSLLPASAVGSVPQQENPVLVKRRDRVQVDLRTGHLLVQLRRAEAMQNGTLGDRIEVMNMDTRRTFVARVVGPGHVVVDP